MSDLTDLQAAQTIKIAGANPSTGVETNFATVDSSGGVSVAGEGTAGTPAGGVLSTQGVSGGVHYGCNNYDAAGNALTSTTVGAKQPLDVNLSYLAASSAVSTSVTLVTGNTAQTALAANTARKWVYFINASGAIIYLGFGFTPTSTTGLAIANGATFQMDFSNLFTGTISAVAPSNNRTFQIIEGS